MKETKKGPKILGHNIHISEYIIHMHANAHADRNHHSADRSLQARAAIALWLQLRITEISRNNMRYRG